MTAIQDLDFVAPRDCELVAYGVAHTLIRAGERVRYFGRGAGCGWEFLVGEGPKSRRLQMRCWDPVLGAQLAALRDAEVSPASPGGGGATASASASATMVSGGRPGQHVKILEADVSRVPSASGMTWVEMPSAITTPTPRPSSEYITLTARNDERCVAAHSIGTGGADESHVSRVLRLAIGAGFAPTNAWDDPTGAEAVFVRFANGTVVRLFAGMNVEAQLRQYAGPDNQPEAVRAAFEEETLRTIFAWKVSVSVPDGYGPVEVRRSSPRETMVAAIIARQVEQGGVDTEGTRHEAERWCAMLAECVCEGMQATTLMGSLKLRRKDMWGRENVLRGTPLGRP